MSDRKPKALQSPADTARTVDTIVSHVQTVDYDGGILGFPLRLSDTNDLTVRTEEYYPLIAQDKVAGHSTFDKIAKGISQSTTAFSIVSNIPVEHPSGVQMTFVSTSVADDLVGTGIQKIQVIGFDSSWNDLEEIIEMDGTTPVTTTSTDWNRLELVEAYQVGSNNVAVGTITAKNAGATEVYAQIDLGENISPRCLHYVKAGCKGFVTDINVSSYTKEGVEFRLVATHDHSVDTPAGGRVLIGRYSSDITGGALPLAFNMILGADGRNSTAPIGIALVARGHAANQGINASFAGYDENC